MAPQRTAADEAIARSNEVPVAFMAAAESSAAGGAAAVAPIGLGAAAPSGAGRSEEEAAVAPAPVGHPELLEDSEEWEDVGPQASAAAAAGLAANAAAAGGRGGATFDLNDLELYAKVFHVGLPLRDQEFLLQEAAICEAGLEYDVQILRRKIAARKARLKPQKDLRSDINQAQMALTQMRSTNEGLLKENEDLVYSYTNARPEEKDEDEPWLLQPPPAQPAPPPPPPPPPSPFLGSRNAADQNRFTPGKKPSAAKASASRPAIAAKTAKAAVNTSTPTDTGSAAGRKAATPPPAPAPARRTKAPPPGHHSRESEDGDDLQVSHDNAGSGAPVAANLAHARAEAEQRAAGDHRQRRGSTAAAATPSRKQPDRAVKRNGSRQ